MAGIRTTVIRMIVAAGFLAAAITLLPNPMPHLRGHMPNMIFTTSVWTQPIP